MKRFAYERNVDTRHTVYAATHIRGRDALLDATRSAAKRARTCLVDEGGYFATAEKAQDL
jgi:hypothetical protein